MCSNVIDISSEDSFDNTDVHHLNNYNSLVPDESPSKAQPQGPSTEITTLKGKALKKKIAEEKQEAKERNKKFKPGECLKNTIIEMHPHLLETWYCADVVREASACGVTVQPSPGLCDQSLVLFARKEEPRLTTSEDGMVVLSPPAPRCKLGLYVCSADDVAEHVHNRTLAQHLRTASSFAGCTLTLLLFGANDYFKSSGRKTLNSSRKLMTELDLEMAITDLLVSAPCDAISANTPNELALAIVQTAKAVAEAPYKKAKRALDEKADFYMRGDNKKCVAIDKNGNGVGRLWQQMVAVLPLSSLEMSRALGARFKTPLELYEVLKSPDGLSQVAELGVTRAAAPGSKKRRIGPEFARKLQILLTAAYGDILVD